MSMPLAGRRGLVSAHRRRQRVPVFLNAIALAVGALVAPGRRSVGE